MISKKTKNKWKIKSKNYFARLKIKKTKKDGEYYDVVFGLIGQKDHAHFGIKVVAENGVIGGKVFFTEARQVTSKHIEKTYNQKTGELISALETPFEGIKGKTGAELRYLVIYNEFEKKAYITKFDIVEIGI
jgi:hypothetical protein